MIHFLNTSVLFVGFAALIPLIIHLFSKRRVKIVEFSSLRHLNSLEKRQLKKIKIRQLFLLILRMLIILMVVLAFSRPTIKEGNIGTHAAVSAVILFDNSESMDRYLTNANLYDLAVDRTNELLSNFSEVDEIVLMPLAVDQNISNYKFQNVSTIRKQLELLNNPGMVSDLGSAIEKTSSLLDKANNQNKEVYLISDLQKSILTETELSRKIDAQFYSVELPVEKIENSGFTGIDLGGQLIIPEHEFKIIGNVKNYSEKIKEDMIISLYIDDVRVAQKDINLSAKQDSEIEFSHKVSRAGFHYGYLETSDDNFFADNRFYFSFKIPEYLQMLIINGDNTGQFIKTALIPSEEINSYWSINTILPTQVAGIDLKEYDLIVLCGAPDIGDTYFNRLRSYVSNGGSIFVTLGTSTDKNIFNEFYTDLTGITINFPLREYNNKNEYYVIESVENNHPIFNIFDYEKNQFPEIKYYSVPQINTVKDIKTLISLTGNNRALTENIYNDGKVITSVSGISPISTDITSHAFFVPLMSRISEYLASDLSSYETDYYCGDDIEINLADYNISNSPLKLVSPNNRQIELNPIENNGSLSIYLGKLEQPGIYSIVQNDKTVDLLAVNIMQSEADLEQTNLDKIESKLGIEKIHNIQQNNSIESSIANFRVGKELWHIFLWVALILIILELIVSKDNPAKENT